MQKFKKKLALVARENLEYNRLKEQRTDAGGKKNEHRITRSIGYS